MKVILTKQVPKVGNAGDIIDVAPGFARNHLLKNGLAREATASAVHAVVSKRESAARRKQKEKKQKEKLRSMLDGETILVRATANEAGNLFGGVGPQEIVASISKRKKIFIDPNVIDLPHHLKTLGVHEVVLHLGGGNTATIHVDIKQPTNTAE